MQKKKELNLKPSLLRGFVSKKTFFLFSLGLLFILVPIIFYINQNIQLMYFTPKIPPINKITLHYAAPLHISIPAVNLDLPVEETAINKDTWGISQRGASHLAVSARPGEIGPIILYAHNTNNRFGPIRWLTNGSSIILTTADNKSHTYDVISTKVVDPKQTTIFFSRKGETLYLYTCDGFADLQRYVVTAITEKDFESGRK